MPFQRKLKLAEEVMQIALERQKIQLSGTLAEQQALREKDEKAARVEQMRQKWSRRVKNQGCARAWTSWYEFWDAKVRAFDLLRHAGSHLRSPELRAGFDEWCGFVKLKAEKSLEKHELGLLGERDALQAQLDKLLADSNSKLAAAKAERAMLIAKIDELGGTAAMAAANAEAQQASERAERAQLLSR